MWACAAQDHGRKAVAHEMRAVCNDAAQAVLASSCAPASPNCSRSCTSSRARAAQPDSCGVSRSTNLPFIEPLLQELAQDGHARRCWSTMARAKSYLGFIPYPVRRSGAADLRHRVAPSWCSSRELAVRLGFAHALLDMSVADAETADLPERFDIVTALQRLRHGHDRSACAKHARFMCARARCQAEVAARLRQTKALSLSRARRRSSCGATPSTRASWQSQITNVALLVNLEASGHQVTQTELRGLGSTA